MSKTSSSEYHQQEFSNWTHRQQMVSVHLPSSPHTTQRQQKRKLPKKQKSSNKRLQLLANFTAKFWIKPSIASQRSCTNFGAQFQVSTQASGVGRVLFPSIPSRIGRIPSSPHLSASSPTFTYTFNTSTPAPTPALPSTYPTLTAILQNQTPILQFQLNVFQQSKQAQVISDLLYHLAYYSKNNNDIATPTSPFLQVFFFGSFYFLVWLIFLPLHHEIIYPSIYFLRQILLHKQ